MLCHTTPHRQRDRAPHHRTSDYKWGLLLPAAKSEVREARNDELWGNEASILRLTCLLLELVLLESDTPLSLGHQNARRHQQKPCYFLLTKPMTKIHDANTAPSPSEGLPHVALTLLRNVHFQRSQDVWDHI